MKQYTVSLVVPCRNEARIIGGFVKRARRYADEVIIVDNNSTDTTVEHAVAAGATVVSETRHKGGIGYGYAHMTGLHTATGDFIVAMDGDDTYPVEEIQRIIRYMDRHTLDFVSCNRLPLTNTNAISRVRRLGIHVLNREVLLLYGFPVRDILSGMWIIRRSAVGKLRLREGDWNLSPEIKLEALKNPDIAFDEYHINHFAREHEISKQQIFKTGFGHLRYIFIRRVTTDNASLKTLVSFARYLFRQTATSAARFVSLFL